MNINEAFPGKYLAAADLKDVAVQVVMSHVTMEKIRDDARPVLYFQGKDKGLVLNKTNGKSISQAYGGETEHWSGKQIELYPTETDYQGQRVACIRVRINSRAVEPQTFEVPGEPDVDEDGVPF